HVGDIAYGEGVISLARAFTYAGASGLITSLWKVDDYASAQIMKVFYGELAQGSAKDQALRKAKLTYLDNCQDERAEHPFFWASLVLYGNTAPVPAGLAWYQIAGLVLASIVTILISRKKLLKSHSMPDAA